MQDQGPQASHAPTPSRWRRDRFLPHVGLLLLVLCGILGTGVYVGSRVIGALPDVGKDLHPAEVWSGPVAFEYKANGWLVAYVAPCAQSPVTGLVVWDDQGQPLWELRGEAFPVSDLLVGTVPPGLKVVHKLAKLSHDQVLRFGVFRPTGRPAGASFRIRDLRADQVRYGGKWVTANEFKFTAKCPKAPVAKQPRVTTTKPTAGAGTP